MGDWSSLTEPLLLDILRRFDCFEEFLSFRRVCRNWRAVAIAASTSGSVRYLHPLLLLTVLPDDHEALYDIVHTRLYADGLPSGDSFRRSIAYSQGYLVRSMDDDTYCRKLLLWNIITEARILLPKAPQRFDRVLLSSRSGTAGGVVVLFKFSEPVLQYLNIGDPQWTVVDCSKSPLQLLSDIIFFKNKIYALTVGMKIIKLDLGAGLKYEVLGDGQGSPIATTQYLGTWLAVSDEELLVVCHKSEGVFHVFRWDFGSNGWVRVRTLGGWALFMGTGGFAGSVDASEMGIRGDCIYYLSYQKDLCLVFSLQDQSITVPFPDMSRLPIGQPIKGDGRGPIWVLPSIC